jgi:hypothetical protein
MLTKNEGRLAASRAQGLATRHPIPHASIPYSSPRPISVSPLDPIFVIPSEARTLLLSTPPGRLCEESLFSLHVPRRLPTPSPDSSRHNTSTAVDPAPPLTPLSAMLTKNEGRAQPSAHQLFPRSQFDFHSRRPRPSRPWDGAQTHLYPASYSDFRISGFSRVYCTSATLPPMKVTFMSL